MGTLMNCRWLAHPFRQACARLLHSEYHNLVSYRTMSKARVCMMTQWSHRHSVLQPVFTGKPSCCSDICVGCGVTSSRIQLYTTSSRRQNASRRTEDATEESHDPGPDLMLLEKDPHSASGPQREHKIHQSQGKRKSSKYEPKGFGKGQYAYSQHKTNKRYNKEEELFIEGEILFGTFPVLLALKAGRRRAHCLHVKHVLLDDPDRRPHLQQILGLARESGTEVLAADTRTLDRLSGGRPHQGLCLDVDGLKFPSHSQSTHHTRPRESAETRPQLWLLLDSIQDPMNFGAILRSSYFLGVDHVFTVRNGSCPPTPVVSKASAGVLEVAPISTVESVSDFIQEKKTEGWRIVGTVGTGQNPDQRVTPLTEVCLEKNTLLLLGNEGVGLTAGAETLCDTLVTIQPGRSLVPDVESLNVSVAAGIVLHQLLSKLR